jgi:hypothetical protein
LVLDLPVFCAFVWIQSARGAIIRRFSAPISSISALFHRNSFEFWERFISRECDLSIDLCVCFVNRTTLGFSFCVLLESWVNYIARRIVIMFINIV